MRSPLSGMLMKKKKVYSVLFYRNTKVSFVQLAWYDQENKEYFTDALMDAKNIEAIESAYYQLLQMTKDEGQR